MIAQMGADNLNAWHPPRYGHAPGPGTASPSHVQARPRGMPTYPPSRRGPAATQPTAT